MQVTTEVDDASIKMSIETLIKAELRNEITKCMPHWDTAQQVKECIQECLPGLVRDAVTKYLGDNDEIKKLIDRSVRARVDRIIKEIA
jgi:methyl coenzyme M reductase alpha subunit